MELLEGETLRERLADGALPARKAVDLAAQIAEGLAAAHEKGIVHRDLKPENVFVTHDGRVKILDFGLAKSDGRGASEPGARRCRPTRRRDRTPGIVLGTVGYMSPEQVRGEAVDHRSDIFSFGAVLYEMLTGRRAFARDTAAETHDGDPQGGPAGDRDRGLGRVAGACSGSCSHCLEKKPAERFQSARDLAFALASSSSVSGVSGAALPAPARASFRPRTWMWAVGSAAAAAALTFLLLHNPRPNLRSSRGSRSVSGSSSAARLSPDGQTVVYSAAWEGRPVEVFAASSDGANPRSSGNPGAIVRLGLPEQGTSPSRRSATPDSTRRPDAGRLPRDGGAARALLENVRDADWGPRGNELAVIHRVQDKDVLEYPIGTALYASSNGSSHRGSPVMAGASRSSIERRDSSVIVVDRKGGRQVFATGLPPDAPGLAWSPDGEEIWLSILDRGGSAKKTWAVNARGALRLLFQDPSLIDLADVAGTVVLCTSATSGGSWRG